MKTFLKTVGVFLAAVAVCVVLAFLVAMASEKMAATLISVSPLVGIASAVGYLKDKRAAAKQ